MRYNTKQLFQNAAQVVASEFGNLYSEGQEVPRRKPSGPFEDTPERASRRHGVETKIKFKEKSKALNARGYIRWLKYYLETGIFPGDFVGEYEDKPVHR